MLTIKTTVGCSIAVMKKTAKVSGSSDGFRSVFPRKKRRSGVLEDSFGGKENSRLWGSKTDNTIESDSIDMKEECLVEETSFDYDESIKTKKALGKPLSKINFSLNNNKNDVFLDTSLELSLSSKNLIITPVCKSFALNIGLDKMVGKSFQEKLQVIRNLFSKINGFGGTSTSSKFAEIIRASFTSESSLKQASKKAMNAKILVNTNLKKSSECSDQTVVVKKILVGTSAKTVCAALFEFGVIKLIKMQLVRLWQKAVVKFSKIEQADLVAACWSILIGKDAMRVARADKDKELMNAHNIWDFIGSVNRKTYVINCHLVMYAQSRCAVVCFKLTEFLDAVMDTTLVLRGMNLHWSHLGFSKYAKYKKIGHTSLGCSMDENLLSGRSFYRALLDIDKSKLATIYAKHSALVAHFVAFGGVSWAKIADRFLFLSLFVHNDLVNFGFSSEIKPTLPVIIDIEKRFAVLESSLTSLTGQINELAERLNLLVQVNNVVMEESLGETTGSETAVNLDSSVFSEAVCFSQAGKINFFIAKTVNKSFFVIFGSNFNENVLKKSTWENSKDIIKMIDYVLVSPNLVSVIVHYDILGVGLGRLLNMQLNSLHKQANRDHWKFNFKHVEEKKWIDFKGATLANAVMLSSEFAASVEFSDLNAM
ncbi:hypothetical protein G9A89_019031 [Geosiphon pyriformis]|nr:hypothetical protein G9A89_019031 [Geosiphon pyriformis]